FRPVHLRLIIPFFFESALHHLDLHSFPTRRSYDLLRMTRMYDMDTHSLIFIPNKMLTSVKIINITKPTIDLKVKMDDLDARQHLDRKSTRLNSSHVEISYAVFCLKKKKKINREQTY